jgi:hypothetical protein
MCTCGFFSYGSIAIGNQAIGTGTNIYGLNIAIGSCSLYCATGACRNIAIGCGTLGNMCCGLYNYAIGDGVMGRSRTGCVNIGMGFATLQCSTGTCNTIIGHNSLIFGACSLYNTGLGFCNMYWQNTGTLNVAVGIYALGGQCSSCCNTAIGACALSTFGDGGSNNIGIGYNALSLTATSSNMVTIGNGANNCYRMYAASWTNVSDCRDKTNICSIPVGLDVIKALRPVKYEWNRRDGARSGDTDSGFLAQEVLQTIKDLNVADWAKLANDDDPDNLMINTGYMIPLLVKAVQELSAEIDILKAK